jgi:hypothetical protein
MRGIAFLILCLSCSSVAAETAAKPQSTASAQIADSLKDLNSRFKTATVEKRDYQEIREIRLEIKKMIPAIRSRAEETAKKNQNEELEINARKSQITLFLFPPEPLPGTTTFPQSQVFKPDYYGQSVDALQRRAQDLKRDLPNKIDIYNKAIEEIGKEKQALGSVLVSSKLTAEQRQTTQDRSNTLEVNRRQQTDSMDRLRQQLSGLDDVIRSLYDLSDREKAFAAQKAEQAALENLVVETDNLLDRLDERAQGILSNDNALNFFTMISTISFATLVGLIIVLFFSVAYKDGAVRSAIFAGDSGIQFITLFSLVIAIILFGVLRILEGKELAALLGGLSGYILGRTSSAPPNARSASTPPRGPTPPPGPTPNCGVTIGSIAKNWPREAEPKLPTPDAQAPRD